MLAVLVAAAPARAATCAGQDRIAVPGAEMQKTACLDDLTTAGTSVSGHTDPSDYESLAARDTQYPTGIPGVQVDGYFPDTSTSNTENGWAHDAQFVLRFPDDWNGKLVVTGAPGVRKQYATDEIISDYVLGRGYAYAATDKGNSGQNFYSGQASPGDAVAEWHRRVTELTRAARATVVQIYGRTAARTYMTGISNGGYLTRFALEHHPELYDGGVDWEGTLMRADGPNLFTYLPQTIANYPRWKAGDEAAHQAIIAAGVPAGSEFLWDYHEAVYWDLSQRVYRETFDPDYDGALSGGVPFCMSGTPSCDADYDYAARPEEVKDRVRAVENTGDIGKPLITLHGTLDALLPISTDSDVYDQLVADAGHDADHRYYVIEGGNHVDGLYDTYGGALRPISPCYREAFVALEAWIERRTAPPPDQTVPKPGSGDVVNTCALAPAASAPTAATGRLSPRGLTLRARRVGRRVRVRGRLRLPSGVARAAGCRGRIVLRAGRRRARATACAFRVTLRAPRARRVRARFAGNAALLPIRTRARIRTNVLPPIRP